MLAILSSSMVKWRSDQGLPALTATSHFIVKKERLMSNSNSTALCRVDGCERVAHYKTECLCQKHYFRFWRNGTTDIVRKTAKPRIEDDRGYQFLHAPGHPLLANGQIYVAEHRIVLFEAIGPGPMNCELCGKPLTWKSCCVDHIDENTRNNERSNLRPTCNPCNARRGTRPAHEWDRTTAITFDGVTKTAHEWSIDPRVNVSGATIKRRKETGMSDFDALFSGKKTHNGNPYIDKRQRKTQFKHERKNAVCIEIDGVMLTAAEWSKNPNCKVSVGGIVWRFKHGFSGKDAVFKEPRTSKTKELRAVE